MPILNLKRLLFAVLALAAAAAPASAQSSRGAKLFPPKVGDFEARRAPAPAVSTDTGFDRDSYEVTSHESRSYAGPDGSFRVVAFETSSPAAAFSLLRYFHRSPASLHSGREGGPAPAAVEGVGAQAVSLPGRRLFVKGPVLFDVEDLGGRADGGKSLRVFARLLADSFEGEAGELPDLVLHLPEWEKKVNEDLAYAVTLPALQEAAGRRPVLDVIDFEGGAEAVTASYGDSRLVIVEFATPQHAFDADAAVNQRIAQLKAAGQPAPTFYRREGNYSVFVFDAPDVAAAERLASGVKYEKDVRWLGRNPHADEIIARRYTSTMGGVIITTLITTGLAILLCLGIGGAIGGVVFLRRRARTDEQQVYTDAGGMQRLNLEDLNTTPASAGLLRQGEE
ncbi:MAG TPA: hypothetical protein VG148_11545 [Pyrinomonadaceae bacterium]|nr:hypothetical protein [Pyrinomonadaceae bacterium]